MMLWALTVIVDASRIEKQKALCYISSSPKSASTGESFLEPSVINQNGKQRYSNPKPMTSGVTPNNHDLQDNSTGK